MTAPLPLSPPLPPLPPFKKTYSCTILPPPFFNFWDSPLWGRYLNFTSPLLKRGRSELCRPRRFHRCHIIETGLSDFRKMTVTVRKMYFRRQGPGILHYRNYKRFSTQSFGQDVFANLHEENVIINQLEKFLKFLWKFRY